MYIEVHEDQIAINVKNRNANKSYAVKQFLSWLQSKKNIPEKFTVFGDNISDLEMGTVLQAENLSFNFVYVGNKDDLNTTSISFKPIITQARFDKGTVEVLSKIF